MRKYLLGTAVLLTLAVSCKKDKGYIKATIVDTGDITADGCGYVLRMEDGKDEKPEYLPSAFQHNGMKVLVKIRSSGVLDTCQFAPPHVFFEKVYIDEIKKDVN
jgi:hypothetical protein